MRAEIQYPFLDIERKAPYGRRQYAMLGEDIHDRYWSESIIQFSGITCSSPQCQLQLVATPDCPIESVRDAQVVFFLLNGNLGEVATQTPMGQDDCFIGGLMIHPNMALDQTMLLGSVDCWPTLTLRMMTDLPTEDEEGGGVLAGVVDALRMVHDC